MMERERRQQDRPVKRLRQLQSRLDVVLRDSKELRGISEAAGSSEVGLESFSFERRSSDRRRSGPSDF